MPARIPLPIATARRWLAAFLIAITFTTATMAPANAQLGPPKQNLWSRWTKSASSQSVKLDHSAFATFLRRNVVRGSDGLNRVRYGKVSAADKALLNRYISTLEKTNVDRLTRNQQMAFWINLYNAKTIDLVVEAYPVKSIRNVRSILTLGPWDDKVLKVGGQNVSLNDIEHRILRPIWKDVRIHYAVNCASVGCPNLRATPFTAARLNAQLEAAARDFINSNRAFRVRNGELEASSIFNWYQSDWGNEAAVLRHARRYANAATKAKLQGRRSIDDYDYDWSLNEAR